MKKLSQSIYIYKIAKTWVYVDIPEEVEFFKLQAQIPGIKKIDIIPEYTNLISEKDYENNHLYFNFVHNDSFQIIQEHNKITLYGIWNETIKTDLPHLLYGILRQYWIEKNSYPVHSFGFENSLLIGHSGNGKTSLALNAIKKGLHVFSNDKTLLSFIDNNLVVLAGTQVLSIRKNLYEQEVLNNSYINNETPVINGDRVVIMTNSLPKETIIKNLYLFFLSDCELRSNKLNIESSLHELYPFFMDTTKTDVIIGNGQCIYNGNNNTVSKQVLIANLNKWLLSHNSAEILIGKKEDIVDYVHLNNNIE